MQSFLASVSYAVELMSNSAIWAFFIGALGALVRDVLDDGVLQLPRIKDGIVILGCFGGFLLGGAAGLLTGGNLLLEFTAGFTGYAVLAALASPPSARPADILSAIRSGVADSVAAAAPVSPEKVESVPDIICRVASDAGVDVKLALAVAEAESSFNPLATHSNADVSVDRGLYQINSKWHPEVSEDQAFNAEFSAKFFCTAVKAGNLSWWNASKPRWIDKVFSA